jgi:hypothetical protein
MKDDHSHTPLTDGESDDSTLGQLSNADLLATLDATLVQLERRLLRYARVGSEVLQMADEGLVLAARAGARLAQAQSAVNHARSHLQVVGVGSWKPANTRLTWEVDQRVTEP